MNTLPNNRRHQKHRDSLAQKLIKGTSKVAFSTLSRTTFSNLDFGKPPFWKYRLSAEQRRYHISLVL
jgi:hypothetical protein